MPCGNVPEVLRAAARERYRTLSCKPAKHRYERGWAQRWLLLARCWPWPWPWRRRQPSVVAFSVQHRVRSEALNHALSLCFYQYRACLLLVDGEQFFIARGRRNQTQLPLKLTSCATIRKKAKQRHAVSVGKWDDSQRAYYQSLKKSARHCCHNWVVLFGKLLFVAAAVTTFLLIFFARRFC